MHILLIQTAPVEILIQILIVYLLAGVLFYFFFIGNGMYKLDSSTKGTSVWFKLLIAPASIALWIFLLIKLLKKKA